MEAVERYRSGWILSHNSTSFEAGVYDISGIPFFTEKKPLAEFSLFPEAAEALSGEFSDYRTYKEADKLHLTFTKPVLKLVEENPSLRSSKKYACIWNNVVLLYNSVVY